MKFWATWPGWKRGALIGASVVVIVAAVFSVFEPYDDFLRWGRLILWLPTLYVVSLLSWPEMDIESPSLFVWLFMNTCTLALYALGGGIIGWLLQRNIKQQSSPPSSIGVITPSEPLAVSIRLLSCTFVFLAAVVLLDGGTSMPRDVLGWLPLLLLVLLPLATMRTLKNRLLICLVLLLPFTYWSHVLTRIPDYGSLMYIPLMPLMVGLVLAGHVLLKLLTEGRGVHFQRLTLLLLIILNAGSLLILIYRVAYSS